jgi:hypothetical protein
MKLIIFSFAILQAGLIKSCAKIDKVAVKEGVEIEKGIMKSEGSILSKEGKLIPSKFMLSKAEVQIFENSNLIYKDLKSNKAISSEFNKAKKDYTEEILEHISDLIPDDEMLNTGGNDEFINKVINEIVSGPNGIILQKIFVYKLRDDQFNKENLRTLLKGGQYDTLKYEPSQLFSIYFKYSQLFASKTLSEMVKNSNCERKKLDEIEAIANAKKIEKDNELFKIIHSCN